MSADALLGWVEDLRSTSQSKLRRRARGPSLAKLASYFSSQI
jgi:hypothetical protein